MGTQKLEKHCAAVTTIIIDRNQHSGDIGLQSFQNKDGAQHQQHRHDNHMCVNQHHGPHKIIKIVLRERSFS